MHRLAYRRNRKNRGNWKNRDGKTIRARFALPLLAALAAAGLALWLAPTTPPMAQAQEATASCGGPGNPLHGRTQKVVDAILTLLGERNCSVITAAQLAGMTHLDVIGQDLGSLQSDDFAGLTSLESLRLYNNDLRRLPNGVFDGLSSLAILRLNNNELVDLPPDLFEGLSSLQQLRMDTNPQLACIHASQFDGLSNLQLLRLQDTQLGNINPTYFTRWSLNKLADLRLGETRISAAPIAFATYQAVLPALVEADTYVNNTTELTDPICESMELLAACGAGNPLHLRTQKVVDVILAALSASDCSAVTAAQLAGITTLDLSRQKLFALRDGDFANLTGLQTLQLYDNSLTTLPSNVFDGRSSLQTLNLYDNSLASLPEDLFNGLSGLQTLDLHGNSLASLPEDLFNGLASLQTLDLHGNSLASLPDDVFDGLSALQTLNLYDNSLASLPDDVFDGLTALQTLNLYDNSLASLPDDVFDGLSALQTLNLYDNSLASLPDDVFDGLTSLQTLNLYDNSLAALPDDVFNGLTSLQTLDLHGNLLATLPEGLLSGLSALQVLNLNNNSLTWLSPDTFTGRSNLQELLLAENSSLGCIHASQFDGLSQLQKLHLAGAGLGNIAPQYFTRWGLNRLAELSFGALTPSETSLSFAAYQAVLPALVEARTTFATGGLSNPICASPERLANCGGTANPLHGRTQKVVDAILGALSASDCSAVSATQLSGITTLDLSARRLSALRDGDFANLTGLGTLLLNDNALTALPEDVFDGLSSLQTLQLYDNSLATLPEDVFDGRASLQTLQLYDNSLTALPEDLFDGLSNLRFLRLENNALETLPPDLFDGLTSLRELRLADNRPLTCIHAGQFSGLAQLQELHLAGAKLGNIAPAPHAAQWGLNRLEELRFGDTRIGSSAFGSYQAEFPALVESRTYVRAPAVLSHPICGFITAETDGGGFHTLVAVELEHTLVYPNRTKISGTSGDGVCGSDATTTRHVLWAWQRSADGVVWTDLAANRQPPDYGVRAAGECSFHYTPQTADDGMYVRAYVPVDTAGVGENNYHSAPFGPLNVR